MIKQFNCLNFIYEIHQVFVIILIPHPVLILALVANAGLFEMLRRQVVMRAAVWQSAAE